jgi:hypothetical protein
VGWLTGVSFESTGAGEKEAKGLDREKFGKV